MKNVIFFQKGKHELPNIKTVTGNIHERINKRFEILQTKTFLENHPMYVAGCDPYDKNSKGSSMGLYFRYNS